jgi:uroporphyrinogen-III synthase
VARDVIPRELGRLADRVDVVEAYETIVPQSSRRRLRAVLGSTRNHPDMITFTSSSTVKNFVALLPKSRKPAGAQRITKKLIKQLENVSLASIGPVTSSTLRALGLRVDIQAREYTIPGLIEAIVAHRKTQT